MIRFRSYGTVLDGKRDGMDKMKKKKYQKIVTLKILILLKIYFRGFLKDTQTQGVKLQLSEIKLNRSRFCFLELLSFFHVSYLHGNVRFRQCAAAALLAAPY